MFRRKLFVLFLLAALIASVFYSIFNQEKFPPIETHEIKSTDSEDVVQLQFLKIGSAGISIDTNLSSTPDDITEEELTHRLQHLSKVCADNTSFPSIHGRRPVFFRSKSTNISCCKVPKTGSSFWGAIIMAIESTNASNSVFNINRNAIHGHNEVFIQDVSKFDTKVMVGRDPYTRLYSAFIDKYFLLGKLGRLLKKAVDAGPYMKDGNTCGYNVTFIQFLDDVTKTALSGGELDEHIVPVSDLCDVCRIKYDMLSRQETLNRDTLYLLRKVNLTATKQTAIQEAISPKGIKHTIHSLIAAHLSDYATYREDCPSRVLHMEKVWTTLQIQGYVNKDVLYPKQTVENLREYKADKITSIILRGIESRPMTKEDKTQQRAMFVRRAYEEVNEESIMKIQAVFMKDFRFLNYDLTPPHKR